MVGCSLPSAATGATPRDVRMAVAGVDSPGRRSTTLRVVPLNPFTYIRPGKTALGATGLLGRLTVEGLVAAGELGRLLLAVLRALVKEPQRRSVIVTQLYHIGYLSLPVVLVSGISIGLVMGVQGYATLVKFNAEVMSGPLVNYALVSQLGPIFTALMVAGRVGSNMSAEIGTMKVTEQLDALRVMGTDPIAYLVAPRFLACVLLLPILTALATLAGVFAAKILLVNLWQIDGGAYWHWTSQYMRAWDTFTGLSKTLVFGGIISLVACRAGLMTNGGATGVGEACTRGVVQGSVLSMVANFVMTLITNKLWHLLHPT
jgi:phospholipid/cholesterol/gamma-HCH transport system permease protein